ncbi:MAG: chemotaxis protein CheX [Deltaproteobacteria bacterium]|jgi:CheY-specific phosphatase CheX|nr:chemotaxis protein CheX [Deltaproteobacteria bacterium]MCW9050450.1 chemotaxis protein CheX [Deltaproteobacteria bacterium]
MLVHNPLYPAMIKATSQTLENMAFMEAMEHFDQAYEIPVEEISWTSMLIHDPVQGEVRLAMSKQLLKKLTGNIFAIDEEEITAAQTNDILKELLNTITGLFMTNLLNADQEYQLGLPELGEGELPEVDRDTIVWKLMTSDEDALQIFVNGAAFVAFKED